MDKGKVVSIKARYEGEPSRQQRLDQLLLVHGNGIRRYLQRLSNTVDIDDVLQEMACRVLEYDHFERLENPRAFLYRCAHNIVMDHYRKLKSHHAYLENHQMPVSCSMADISALDYNELIVAFKQALPELPVRCRQVFLLRCREGLNNAEVAAKLGISIRMVQKHMTKALAHFQSRLGADDGIVRSADKVQDKGSSDELV